MTKTTKSKSSPTASKWRDSHYVTAYEAARDGGSKEQIAAALGMSSFSLDSWRKKKPALDLAISRGREVRGGTDAQSFRDYVYQRLPKHLRELWDKIHACEKKKSGLERVEALLHNAGKQVRQSLFIYALTATNFNFSRACRMVNINLATFEQWKTLDPDFAELLDEIHWHKKNFFENSLIGRCASGDTSAIIFANRTFNRDRGYADKQEIEHSGEVTHLHAGLRISDLDLPLETKKQILEAIRKHKLEHKTEEPIDVEAHRIEDKRAS